MKFTTFRKLKKLKVSYLGQPLREIYPHATWFQVQRYRFNKVMEILVIGSFIAGVAFQVGRMTSGASTTFAREEVKVEVDKSDELLAKKIDTLKTDVINQLISCEAPGYKDTDVVVTFDPLVSNPSATAKRNIPSYGPLQFKQDTVIHYYKLMTGKDITAKDSIMIALDRDQSTELAKFVGFKTKNKFSGDWKNCSERLNLDAQVDLIHKLEK